MKRGQTEQPNHVSEAAPLERVTTGVAGLDATLMGGFLKGGIYLLMAPPGAGKTILANQLAFHHVRGGGNVVYFTLLAESHSRMFSHLQSLSFFDLKLVSRRLTYLSAYRTIEEKGLTGLLGMLQQVVRKSRPSILILDGVAVADELSQSGTAFKKFVHQLNTFATGSGCTTFLLSSLSEKQNRPEHTMVDGIISMDIEQDGMRTVRELEVRKFRGSDHLHGRHYYRISQDGLRIYPRLESLPTVFAEPAASGVRASTDIAKLDAMLGGGFLGCSTSLILGAPGTGKTVLALHFLKAGIDAGEPCLYFGFYENPERLLRKARALGLDCGQAVATGALKIMWRPPLEHYMDALAEELLEYVRAHRVTRLCIDGVDGLRDGGIRTDRMKRYMVALTNELRTLGVTTLITEGSKLFKREVDASISAFSAITENLLFLKQVELTSELSRMLCLIKVCEGEHDLAIRRFDIVAKRGIVIGERIEALDETLTGQPRATEGHTRSLERPQSRERGAKGAVKRPAKSPPAKPTKSAKRQ